MKLTTEHKLYSISIDDGSKPRYTLMGSAPQENIIVVAKDIHEASVKAMQYIVARNKEPQPVVTKEGDLNLDQNEITIGNISTVKCELIF